MKRGTFLLLLVICQAAPAVAQAPPSRGVVVRAWADRTALWVGDRTTLTLEFACAPDVDILVEDLAKDRVRIEGGEILQADAEQEETGGRLVRRMRYTVTTYQVDTASIRVPAFSVRYFSRRTLGAAAETAPQGEARVPETTIAIRSTLPETGRLPELREPSALHPAPRYVNALRVGGLVLIALAIVPAVFAAIDLAGRARRVWARGLATHARRQHRRGFDELRALDPSTPAERVEAYRQLDLALREDLRLATGIPAHALTPGEIRQALEARGSASGQDADALLGACEHVRYAPDPVAREGWDGALATAEQILSRRWR